MVVIKKIGLIVLILISFLIFINIIEEPSIISKFIFTMKGITDTVSLSITVDAGVAPNVTIYEPKSRVYGFGKNMWLSYNVVDDGAVSNIWFNLNNGSNISLDTSSNNFYFNVSEGNHTLYMFANDTQSNLNDAVFVNFTLSKYDIINYEINDSGVITFFDDPTVSEYFRRIEGLNSSWTINITIHGNNTPEDFVRPTNVGEELLYFELFANTYDDTSGSYDFYFNLSKATLAEVSSSNIRAYYYAGNWNELSTSVEDETGDPISFKAVLTHLSQFMIGEKGSSGGTSSPASATGTSKGDREKGQEESIPEEPGVIEPKPPEIVDDVISDEGDDFVIPKFEPVEKLSWFRSLFTWLGLVAFLLIVIYLYQYRDKMKKQGLVKKIFLNLRKIESGKHLALLVMLFLGVLYALSSYSGITGAVVGNLGRNGNELQVITFIMIILAFIYFFIKKD
ncbi:MAG: hypothetical protein AABW46_04645 [Nanoarchaeota archaeon]